ncbi:MAG: o-succinylbenzoate synthase [Bacteroidota bacterium]
METFQYRLPFRQPFETQNRKWRFREGLLFRWDTGDYICYGEAAPLPGFSRESLNEVASQYAALESKLTSALKRVTSYAEWWKQAQSWNLLPSLAFALDTLVLDYLAQSQVKTVRHLLNKNARSTLPVNAVLSLSDAQQALSRTKEYIDQGYSTVKIKVGKNTELETQLLEQIRSQFPDLIIRLDANKAWTFNKAEEILGHWQRFDLEYCEEPLQEATSARFKDLYDATGVPLAWDESLSTLPQISSILADGAAQVLILKPMRIGHIGAMQTIVDQARQKLVKVVFTSLLETAIGRQMTAQFAASQPASDQIAHGLATGNWLAVDFNRDPQHLIDGHYHLSAKSGLGFATLPWPPEHSDLKLTKRF